MPCRDVGRLTVRMVHAGSHRCVSVAAPAPIGLIRLRAMIPRCGRSPLCAVMSALRLCRVGGTCFPVLSGRIRMNPRSEGTDRGLACFFSPTEGKAFRELKAAHRGFPTEMARLDGESPIGPSPQIAERSMQGPDLSPHLADCSTTAPWKGPRHDARCESGVHSPCLARAPDAPPGPYPRQGESFPNSC